MGSAFDALSTHQKTDYAFYPALSAIQVTSVCCDEPWLLTVWSRQNRKQKPVHHGQSEEQQKISTQPNKQPMKAQSAPGAGKAGESNCATCKGGLNTGSKTFNPVKVSALMTCLTPHLWE